MGAQPGEDFNRSGAAQNGATFLRTGDGALFSSKYDVTGWSVSEAGSFTAQGMELVLDDDVFTANIVEAAAAAVGNTIVASISIAASAVNSHVGVVYSEEDGSGDYEGVSIMEFY